MNEDNIYALLSTLAEGRVYPYVAPLGTNGVVAATFSLRLKGKPENIESGS
ncbi:hypothetical protein [Enterobacter cloacae complex sp. SHL011]|uniref:hypothetical protein n=1 Tax=Enterobacter cloacae complex sp. SHL011 TaxID=3412394 RepID=UPI003B998C49